jgi:hypothetical protein
MNIEIKNSSLLVWGLLESSCPETYATLLLTKEKTTFGSYPETCNLLIDAIFHFDSQNIFTIQPDIFKKAKILTNTSSSDQIFINDQSLANGHSNILKTGDTITLKNTNSHQIPNPTYIFKAHSHPTPYAPAFQYSTLTNDFYSLKRPSPCPTPQDTPDSEDVIFSQVKFNSSPTKFC